MGSQMAPQLDMLRQNKPDFQMPQMMNQMQNPMQSFVGAPISGGLDSAGIKGPLSPQEKDDIRRQRSGPRRGRRRPGRNTRRGTNPTPTRPAPRGTGFIPPNTQTMSSPSIMMY